MLFYFLPFSLIAEHRSKSPSIQCLEEIWDTLIWLKSLWILSLRDFFFLWTPHVLINLIGSLTTKNWSVVVKCLRYESLLQTDRSPYAVSYHTLKKSLPGELFMHWTLTKGKMELSKPIKPVDRTLEGGCISNSEQKCRSITYRTDHNIWNMYFSKVPATDFNIDILLHMIIIHFYYVSLKKKY